MTDCCSAPLRVIGIEQRLWARRREFQKFYGYYQLHGESGLYFAQGSDKVHIELVLAAFLKLPEVFKDLCHQWQVTFSFAERYTAIGSMSAFYADFTAESADFISPHIEMSDQSLSDTMVLPHLAHELAHLFWRTRIKSQRIAYRDFLENSCGSDTLEVTAYVQDLYGDYLNSLSRLRLCGGSPIAHCSVRDRWVQESFCETVAARLSQLDAEEFESNYYSCPNHTVDMTARLVAMIHCFGLEI